MNGWYVAAGAIYLGLVLLVAQWIRRVAALAATAAPSGDDGGAMAVRVRAALESAERTR